MYIIEIETYKKKKKIHKDNLNKILKMKYIIKKKIKLI